MPDVIISFNSFLRKPINSSPIFFNTSIGIRSGQQALFPFIIASWFLSSSTDIGGTSPEVSGTFCNFCYNCECYNYNEWLATLESGFPNSEYWCELGLVLFVIGRCTHFDILNCICHLSDHFSSWIKSVWRIWWSMFEFILRYIMLSSANRRILDWTFSLMSLMYSKKRMCRRSEPYGTPDVTSVMFDRAPLTEAPCLRFDRTDVIQLCVLPVIPYEVSLVRRRLCGTLSKALAKSRRIAPICVLLSNAVIQFGLSLLVDTRKTALTGIHVESEG